MAKEKIVRCTVSKTKNGKKEQSVRYVPFEIFDLWKLLMTDKHQFEVEGDQTSLWFDIDGDPNVTYADANYDKVIKLSLWVYSEEDGMFRKIVRYFPSESYNTIKPRFLSHYTECFSASRFAPRIDETRGVWLKREDQ